MIPRRRQTATSSRPAAIPRRRRWIQQRISPEGHARALEARELTIRREIQAEHRQKSSKGTETIKTRRQQRLEDFQAAYRKHHVGKVSHTTAVERAGEDVGVRLSTAWGYAAELGLTNSEK